MIVIGLLTIMALQDAFTMHVSDLLQILLLIVIIVNFELQPLNIAVAVSIMISYYIYQRNTSYKIGGADIKLIALFILISITNTLSILFWSSLLAIIYSVCLKRRKVPYVPFLSLGYLIVNI